MNSHLYYIFLGLTPAIFLMWYIYKKDVWEPEPKRQIIKIFLLGIVAILPAGLFEYVFQYRIYKITPDMMMNSIVLNMTICFLVLAPLEELFKYSVVKGFMYHHPDFNEKMDGVIYMVAAAMGFSALENVMAIFQVGFRDPSQATYTGIMCGVLATPAHAIFSGFLGVYLGRAKFADKLSTTVWLIAQGFAIAVLLHGLYDALTFAKVPSILGVIPLLLISGFILLKQIGKLADESPFKKTQQNQAVQTL